jgi:hypothetical protein
MTGSADDGPAPADEHEKIPAPPPRSLVAAIAVACAGTLVAGIGYAAASDSRPAAGRSPSGPAAAQEPPQPQGALDLAAVRALLDRRDRAVRTRDRAAFLSSVAAAFRPQQQALFDDLAKLPLANWRQRADSGEPVATAPGGWIVRLTLRYRLRGYDHTDVVRTQYLTFARRPGGVVIAGDGAAEGFSDDTEIWDGGPLTVVRGHHSLVIGNSAPTARLRQIADRLDQAVPTVTGVAGRGWARSAVALVPATEAQTSALVGGAQSLREIAALATVLPGPHGTEGDDRIVVSPVGFPKLNAIGRHVVLTHELTHVATHGAGDSRTPSWLIEGFADYVGYKGVAISVRSAARELRRDVADGKVPRALPGPQDFAGASGRLSQAYEEAWLACRMVAERYGEPRLVRLYRAAGRRPDAIREVLGVDDAEFTAMWRSYLRRELG